MKELKAKIEQLPPSPRWKATTLDVRGFETRSPLTLFWRDAAECVQLIFGNPILAESMEYAPYRIYNSSRKLKQFFAGTMTGEWAWNTQVTPNLPPS